MFVHSLRRGCTARAPSLVDSSPAAQHYCCRALACSIISSDHSESSQDFIPAVVPSACHGDASARSTSTPCPSNASFHVPEPGRALDSGRTVCSMLLAASRSLGSRGQSQMMVAHFQHGSSTGGTVGFQSAADAIRRGFSGGRGQSSAAEVSASSTASDAKPLFSKILVANRGEIACRVMRTARRMGIKSVAVYSDPDADGLHVRTADEAVRVGPAAAAQSYLSIDAIMDAIRRTGAEAVHPGYGFLSENAAFVKRLEDEGVIFIGPTAHAIGAMGDKIESKRLARAAGVTTVPGRNDLIKDSGHAVEIAREVGFPVMMKASGGGGGKGMRIAWNEAEVKDQFELCRAEALSSFADDRIFIERYIEEPRHIEIQIMGDKHGNVVWLPERECSIQRRNQKIIEEAPSTFLDASTRRAMGEQAVALAKAVGYDSAGTVEFLVDKNRGFYFLEMNTRLQVEHPVTECITGLDLVEQMFRVAAGQRLELTQERAQQISGWAMESRVYCEHAAKGFLPSTGFLRHYEPPLEVHSEEEIVRIDGGVSEGDEITMFYDPLMSKLVTWGPDRGAAISSMQKALDHYLVEGPQNNVAFLRCIFHHPEFAAGRISTNFLKQHYPQGWRDEELPPAWKREFIAIAAFLHASSQVRATSLLPATSSSSSPSSPLSSSSSLATVHFSPESRAIAAAHQAEGGQPLVVSVDGQDEAVRVNLYEISEDGLLGADVAVDGETVTVEASHPFGSGKGVVDLIVNDEAVGVQVQQVLPRGYQLLYKGSLKREVLVQSPAVAALQQIMPPPATHALVKALISPMPGAVVDIAVKEGQEVLPGNELVTIEAMKMRNVLRAEEGGKVAKIHVTVGGTVGTDDVILQFE